MTIPQYYRTKFLKTYQWPTTGTEVTSVSELDTLPEASVDALLIDGLLNETLDYEQVIRTAKSKLKVGGVLFTLLGSIAPSMNDKPSYWGFALAAANYLFQKEFGESNVEIQTYGNVLAGRVYLTGGTAEELSEKEIDYVDKYYPIIMGVKATRN